MAWTEAELRRRARRAYELGRLRRSLRAAWPVVPLGALAAITCGPFQPTLLACAVLAATVVAFAHVGRAWGRAIGPGLLAVHGERDADEN